MAQARLALCFSLVYQQWLISVTFPDKDGEPQGNEGDVSHLPSSPPFTTDCFDAKPFYPLLMADLSEGELDAPFKPRWLGLMVESGVWLDGSFVVVYEHIALYPALAK
ncbi:hypothetical protein B296_00006074 [Ensete ventricosum]|uniref:Uncharacterized protein n=1 Tax=Ensete ventricosum TaxID=4639 RepID=A0A426Z7Q1_ENSVE|nr:hypothetical protein B296_00006074 [Ensete ventricosum]